jgi:8-oxo-dGTP pyrophosphatase MutT (NUDIX family)
VLITDLEDRVLLVSNPYRDALVMVGGMVEAGESPAAAAERETLEETGLKLTVTRLLVVHHRPAGTRRETLVPDTFLYVFDSAPVDSATPLVLQPNEITEAFWLAPADAIARHTEPGRPRLAAAFKPASPTPPPTSTPPEPSLPEPSLPEPSLPEPSPPEAPCPVLHWARSPGRGPGDSPQIYKSGVPTDRRSSPVRVGEARCTA